ncbi:Beta-galactosidase BgaA [Paenibacillus allorhizoplanae]|uniref:beta-galactosidase n=1 Tax=Paenibacillus allorhizoplanae TaxID=2905648 RepID=A0ABN8GBP9_9BACL|nr:alpha-amylase family protein [Paenibacillus allorhizoplanae]CAH1201789.1 Beta-galactosidase BgaA [Paenibacillus allorhizoplanae]
MEIGVAYYPEHEKSEQWPIDYKKLQEAGIPTIRIAEFAWSTLEPEDGQYNWTWLDESIEFAAEFGIGVVLCTPTACPPIWLVEKYPDVLPVHKSGKTVGFGARQHRSYYSANYLAYSKRIVSLMAERYGQHPNVIAWQLDNEFGGETKYDYSEYAKQAFQQYLADKYGTIAHLNQAWGTVFWSQQYQTWAQIPLPVPIQSDVMMWPHPSLELEFARFSSQGLVQFARMQERVLRPHIGERPITTNGFMFCWGDNINWVEMFATLDVVGMDIYSDKPHEIAFYSDASRSVLNKPFWMMEYGAGAGQLERDMRIIEERGCERFFLFKMKPFPWGQEQGRGGKELLTLTGEPSHNYNVIQRYTEAATTKVEDEFQTEATVGLYYHFDSSWSYQISVSDRLPYANYVVDNVYRSLFEMNKQVDVVYTPRQIKAYELLILPLNIMYEAELEEALIAYVHNGGKLVVTTDLFRKNDSNVFLTEVPKLFRVLFDWQANNFVTDVVDITQPIVLEHETGRGKSWLIARDISSEEWREVIERISGAI